MSHHRNLKVQTVLDIGIDMRSAIRQVRMVLEPVPAGVGVAAGSVFFFEVPGGVFSRRFVSSSKYLKTFFREVPIHRWGSR
jgi:hypothetical protein